jgi:hypothetical protein
LRAEGGTYIFSVIPIPNDPRENESCVKSHPMLSEAKSIWKPQSLRPNPRAKSDPRDVPGVETLIKYTSEGVFDQIW